MSDENQQKDSLQPSWATRELFALGVTLVLAVWVVAKYGKETQPQSLTAERDKARAEKRAETTGATAEDAPRRPELPRRAGSILAPSF